MDFRSENWDEVVPYKFHNWIWKPGTLYELIAMADGPKLPAGTSDAKRPQYSSFH